MNDYTPSKLCNGSSQYDADIGGFSCYINFKPGNKVTTKYYIDTGNQETLYQMNEATGAYTKVTRNVYSEATVDLYESGGQFNTSQTGTTTQAKTLYYIGSRVATSSINVLAKK